jgi:hypothetical protein
MTLVRWFDVDVTVAVRLAERDFDQIGRRQCHHRDPRRHRSVAELVHQASGPDHWQTHGDRELPDTSRLEVADWYVPRKDDWVRALDDAIGCAAAPLRRCAADRDRALVGLYRGGPLGGVVEVLPAQRAARRTGRS